MNSPVSFLPSRQDGHSAVALRGLVRAEALLQIAIVLTSVAIVANLAWLAYFGGVIGIVGLLLTINGFWLLVEIPGLA